jgi:dihydroorotate dehydrogenase (NAD+) catalytic subunit
VAAARAVTSKPLYAKLSPMLPSIPAVASAAAEAGVDGLSLVNTIRGCALDERTLRPTLSTWTGGLSGPPLKAVALAAVLLCAKTVDLPIVGMGGVACGRDALELIAAGASAVALGTVLFSDPDAPARIRAELAAEAASFGVDNALELRAIALSETLAVHSLPVENHARKPREKASISTEIS